MDLIKGSQKKYLRGLAHSLKPLVIIGIDGVNLTVIKALDLALSDHELVKVKFNKFKEEKKELAAELEFATKSIMVGLIGNVAIFYRMSEDKEKRKIKFPS